MTREELETRMALAVAKRQNSAKFSDEWFSARNEIEDLAQEISKLTKLPPVPEDFVVVDWDAYDD